jgi:methyl-accepting chemotaxis protein
LTARSKSKSKFGEELSEQIGSAKKLSEAIEQLSEKVTLGETEISDELLAQAKERAKSLREVAEQIDEQVESMERTSEDLRKLSQEALSAAESLEEVLSSFEE